MHRIANYNSFHVVYFQHGILDNSVTWVLHGPEDSIAYQAYEKGSIKEQFYINESGEKIAIGKGCDVFLGNFRGIYPRKMAKWRRDETYWDRVRVEDYAQQDIKAFIKKIREIKKKDLTKIL